ncbi:hypothetical protein [Pararhizobium sp. A13]|uniref:hypothetical protein n=1 Tax=Pararhizobium sp. A13 TaxID=3133975 RepID=UPI0032534D22
MTSRFELDVQRHQFGPYRIAYNFKVGKKGAHQETIKVYPRGITGFSDAFVEYELANFPIPIVLPLFDPPRLINGTPPEKKRGQGFRLWHAKPKAPYSKGAVEVWTTFNPTSFIRTLAKIAYCVAVDRIGIDNFMPLVLGIIHGDDASLDNWNEYIGVGSLQRASTDAYTMEIFASAKTRLIVVDIRFFSFAGAPTYSIAVGYLKDVWQEDWPQDTVQFTRHGPVGIVRSQKGMPRYLAVLKSAAT